MDEMVDEQVKVMEHNGKRDMVVLSIIGNDLGFSQILKSCVYLPDAIAGMTCKEAIKAADDLLDGDTIKNKLYYAWGSIKPHLYSGYGNIYQESYPKFFIHDTPVSIPNNSYRYGVFDNFFGSGATTTV